MRRSARGLLLFVVMAIAVRMLGFRRPGLARRHLHSRLRDRAHRVRIFPRAGRAARLPVRRIGAGPERRHHHGNAAVDPHGAPRHRGDRRCHAGRHAIARARPRDEPRRQPARISSRSKGRSPSNATWMSAFGITTRRATLLGAGGDFTTSPEISQIFGELLGLWMVEVWHEMGRPAAVNLVELGPGRGTLMADMLRAARVLPEFLAAACVHLVETSPALRHRQKATLAAFRRDDHVARQLRRRARRPAAARRQRVLRCAAGPPVRRDGARVVRAPGRRRGRRTRSSA